MPLTVSLPRTMTDRGKSRRESVLFHYADTMESSAMGKAIAAMFALAAVGLFQPTVATAFVGGFSPGAGYPASFGSDNDNAPKSACRLVSQRVKTQHGWRVRQVQVCN